MSIRPTRFLAFVATALLAVGCAQSNGDISQVQPNVVKKADFLDGTWFYRNTVTYTPFNTQFTYPGQTGSMEKLVWEIQEHNLVGYRSYPYIVGAEANVDQTSKISGTTAKYCDKTGKCVGGQKYYGSPVVAYKIEGQFDIQRGYNNATGEQTNVISENSTDRIWNDREYMRVDWAANILNQNSGLSFGTIQNPASGVTSSNWIQPNEPGSSPYDWPTFEYNDKNKDGSKELTYFDITGRYFAVPDSVYFEGYGTFPYCFFQAGIYDCTGAEIHIRTSLSKIDEVATRDYEPLQYDNDLMTMFGYFRTERLNYDKRFGFNNSAVIRLGNRHRNWKEYYKKNANGEVTDQAIPLAEREMKPVVYYFTPAERMGGVERYDEFFEPGKTIESGFDRAFRRATAAAQGKNPADIKQAFYLCNNPVKANDREACGKEGFSPKIGDLRYSFVNTVAEPVANGLLGYGPSSPDPETGQIISGMSNTYTWGVDLYGQEVLNHIKLLEGETKVTDYISGNFVDAFVKSNPVYNLKNVKTAAELKSELQGIPQRAEQTKGAWDRPTERMSTLVQRLVSDKQSLKSSGGEVKRMADELAKHPTLEAAVLDNPDVQTDLLGLLPAHMQPLAEKDPAFLRNASRSVLINFTQSQEYEKKRIQFLSKNSITTLDFNDRTLVGVATELNGARKALIATLKASGNAKCANTAACTDAEAIKLGDEATSKKIRQSVWLATALHETGHTLNLRHNFQGSYDSVNYQDQYWNLRRDSLTMIQNGEAKLARTPTDMKLIAEGTDIQKIEGIHQYEYSSIMDYAGKIYTDWKGIGKYDEAALIFAYSGTTEPGYVEVFNGGARKTSQSFPGTDGAMMTISGAGADLPMVNASVTSPTVRNYTERFHYSTVPLHFGTGADITNVIDDGITKLKNRRLAKWSEVKKDEDRVRAAMLADPTLINDPDRASGIIGTPLLRVPYMFCSDDSADGPVLSCNRFDRGPDYYEMVRTKLEDYWNYYYDSHFRKQAIYFNGNRAFNSAYRTFDFTANSYKHWVFELYKDASKTQEQVSRFKFDPIFQDMWTLAVLDGVNSHLNVMSVPPDGLFYYRNTAQTAGPRWDVANQGDDYDYLNSTGTEKVKSLYTNRFGAQDFVLLPRGLGRRMYSRYNAKSGFRFQYRMEEAGHSNDQIGAMFAAAIPGLDLQGVDSTADQNRYSISYHTVFPKEFENTFSALWSNDEDKIRPTMYKTVNELNQVQEKSAIASRVYVKGSELFQGFNYPKDLPGTCTGNQMPPSCFLEAQHAAPANIQLTYTSRIYGLLLGMVFFRNNNDLDYAKSNQVFKTGGEEAFAVASGYHTVSVDDPNTGHRYLAVEKNGAAPDSTPAVRMISIGNQLRQMVDNPAICPLPQYVFLLGFQCLDAAQANNAAIIEDRRKYWLEFFQDHVRDLDYQRGYYGVFGKAF
jgi:hypothetical protein